MALISVIVPIYKAEKYLEQCIRSILSQTVQDIELLLINDGSPDRCGDICEAYAGRDGRIRYFSTPNQGTGPARNLGMKHAEGEWLCFVDSDDYLPADSLEKLLRVSRQADIVIGDYLTDKAGRIVPRAAERGGSAAKEPQYYRLIGCALRCFHCLGAQDIYNTTAPWGKLYRRAFCREHMLAFPAIRRGEDVIFNLLAYQKTDRIVFTGERVYAYRLHAASECHRYIPDFEDRTRAYLSYLEKTLDTGKDPRFADMLGYVRQRYLILNINQTAAHPSCPLNRRERLQAMRALCEAYEIKTRVPKVPRKMFSPKQRFCLWLLYREHFGAALCLFEIKRIYSRKFGYEC